MVVDHAELECERKGEGQARVGWGLKQDEAVTVCEAGNGIE